MSNARHAYRLERASLEASLIYLLVSIITSRISNMGESINVLSFNVNFLFQI